MEWTEGQILDVEKLDGHIHDLCRSARKEALSGGSSRQALLELFRAALEKGRKHLHQSHLEGAPSTYVVRGHSFLMDTLLQRIHAITAKGEHASPKKLALVATGGYGRGELAPYSDVDLLFLLPDKIHPKLGMQAVQTLYFLWDLGLEVGHAVRDIDECVEEATQDVKIHTALLESRFLAGNRQLFKRYQQALFQVILAHDRESFLHAKLAEQRARHERFGNSLFILEPNVKESPGGLRDVHTFFWISKYHYRVNNVKKLIPKGLITENEYLIFTRGREFLRRVRNALHYRARRREDRLTFNRQMEIAAEFGYRDRPGMRGVEQFMRRFYQVARQVSDLSGIFLSSYQEEFSARKSGATSRHVEDIFWLAGDKLTVMRDSVFREDPRRVMHLFALALRLDKGIHPQALRLVRRNLGLINREYRRNPEVNRLFLSMFEGEHAVDWVLRTMNMCGVLGRFIPEFGRIIGQTQHDLYHVYTVDEHTLMAMEALRHIKSGRFIRELPLSSKLMSELSSPLVLNLAVLFHDIAKGRNEGHADKGATIAHQVCLRLGVTREESEKITWLVKYHLVMSRTAFRRDIHDPQTLAQFARVIGEKERLDLLLLLTVADIRAVGPGIWNQWKADLLRKLYTFTAEILDKGLLQPEQMKPLISSKKAALAELLAPHLSEGEVEDYLNRFYPDYFLNHDPQAMAGHYFALASVMESSLVIHFSTRISSDTTEMLIYTQDHPGLMARISGAIAAAGANILSANINTTTDGMAMDIYVLENWEGGAIEEPDTLRRIDEMVRQVITRRADPAILLAKNPRRSRREDPFPVPTAVSIDNQFSDAYSVLEVTARDQPGLLFTITNELTRQGIQISTAKIATYGERAVDVFYIKDIFGLKILNNKKISQIQEAITQSIDTLTLQMNPPTP